MMDSPEKMLVMHLATTSGRPPSEIEATWDLEELTDLRIYNLIEPMAGFRQDLLLTRIFAALIGKPTSELMPDWGGFLWEHLPVDPQEALKKVLGMFTAVDAQVQNIPKRVREQMQQPTIQSLEEERLKGLKGNQPNLQHA